MNTTTRISAVERSALWAAYGDALGFITELAPTRSQVQWRAGIERISQTVQWRRKIGGRFGVVVEMPTGMYSDDTQLRLAACRSIRADGVFDVEAFAKVELPVWLSYALGGGIGTKAAASYLSRREITWNRNFFEDGKARYVESGGNGAAMRIHPHVWAAPDADLRAPMLLDVVRNSITSHGHPRAIVGAVFHAVLLKVSLEAREVAGPQQWSAAVPACAQVAGFMSGDQTLATWMNEWSQVVGRPFVAVWEETCKELSDDVSAVSRAKNYGEVLSHLGGTTEQYRGTGTRTAVAAAWLAWEYRQSPVQALIEAANAIGSDTDTIATMAGALLGVVAPEDPPGPVADSEYIREQARRLVKIAAREPVESFKYPDLLYWDPPRTQVDAVGAVNGDLALSGLGVVRPTGPALTGPSHTNAVWQWGRLSFGQTVLVKRRPEVADLASSAHPRGQDNAPRVRPSSRQPQLFESRYDSEQRSQQLPMEVRQRRQQPPNDLDAVTGRVIQAGFDPNVIGRTLLQLAEQEGGIEKAYAFAAIVAKAWRARKPRV